MIQTLVVIASLLSVVGNVPYLIDCIRGKVKPHPYTWLLWTVVSAVVFLGQVVKGGGVGSIPTFASEIFTVFIFFISLRYGFKYIKKSDTFFLIVALLGLIPWWFTKDPTISVVIVVSIDLIAFVPTLKKTWRQPETENAILFFTNVIRHILTLFVLESHNVATTLHSIAMIVTNTLMVWFILRKRK